MATSSINAKRDRRPSPVLFVPRFGNWLKAEFVAMAHADPDLDDLFRCECGVCGPHGDVRKLVSADVDARLRDHHSIAAAVAVARSVVAAPDRLGAWHDLCLQAVHAYETLDWMGITGPTDRGVSQEWLELIAASS